MRGGIIVYLPHTLFLIFFKPDMLVLPGGFQFRRYSINLLTCLLSDAPGILHVDRCCVFIVQSVIIYITIKEY